MANHESNGYQEDPWGDDDEETAGNKSSSRQEPFLSPDDGISFAGDSSHTDSVAHEPDAQTAQPVESGFNHDDQPAPDKKGKKAKVKKEKKPMSTAKIALFAGGGLFVLAIVGAGVFWFISKPSEPAPVSYMPRPAPHLSDEAKGSVALPNEMVHPAKAPMVMNKPAMVTQPPVVASSAMTNEAMNSTATSTSGTIVSVGETRSVTAPSVSTPASAMGAAIPNSMTLPSAPASSASDSLASSSYSTSSSNPLNTQNANVVSNNASSNQSVLLMEHKYQAKMAEMSAKIESLKTKIDSEQKALDEMHHQTSSISPRVVYRTVVRYVPQPAPQIRHTQELSSLPSGYTLAGGSGNSVLVKTPSGAYRTIRSGDTLNGQMVKSVHNGHVSMGE